tara:strand:+ start:629 stop:802 length:174 start_codon:yes stop_codon:yes gene_type:complete
MSAMPKAAMIPIVTRKSQIAPIARLPRKNGIREMRPRKVKSKSMGFTLSSCQDTIVG